jgi:hypothetical protein
MKHASICAVRKNFLEVFYLALCRAFRQAMQAPINFNIIPKLDTKANRKAFMASFNRVMAVCYRDE